MRCEAHQGILFYGVLLLQNAYTAVQCEHNQCALFQLYLMMRIDAHQVVWWCEKALRHTHTCNGPTCMHLYLYYCIVFILSCAVVSIEMEDYCMKTMILQVIVHHTDDSISTFTCIKGLINKKSHLLWDGSTTNTKDPTFSGCQKVNWTWLQRT